MTENNGLNQFFRGGVAVARKIKLGTAVDSDIAVIIVVSVPCIVGYMFNTQLWPLLPIGFWPIVAYTLHYQQLLKTKPEYLRSEKHTENMHRIDVGAMGDSNKEISQDVFEELQSIGGTSPKLKGGDKK